MKVQVLFINVLNFRNAHFLLTKSINPQRDLGSVKVYLYIFIYNSQFKIYLNEFYISLFSVYCRVFI